MNDPNERRLLLAVAVSLALVFAWQQVMAVIYPPPPDPVVAESAEGTPVPAPGGAAPAEIAPAPAAPASVPGTEVPCTGTATALETTTARLEVTDCGAVRSMRFKGVPAAIEAHPWWSWAYDRISGAASGDWSPYSAKEGELDLLENGEFLAAGQGPYAAGGTWTLQSASPLVQSRTTPEGLRILRTFEAGDSPDTWKVTVRFESDHTLTGPLWVGVHDTFSAQVGRSPPNAGLMALANGSLKSVTTPSSITEPQDLAEPAGWFGVATRFELAAAAPVDPGGAHVQWARLGADRIGGFLVLSPTSVGPGASVSQVFNVYVGPREVSRLEAAGHDFAKSTSLGIFGLFAKFLLVTLHLIHDAIGSWGYSILALTFLVRLATYPLQRTAVVAGRKMQALQPLVKELQAKYADDKEALNRETMALYSKNGVNPLGGCLPMLVQMPVFFALFTALAYEPQLFHSQFFYLHDLSAPDPFGVLGLFVMAGMYVQQAMNPAPGMDPTQAQMMKFMPLMFGFFMFSAPAGLSLYYSLNTVLAILQQWYNTRSIPLVPPGDANVPS